jgi:hypothetical protein
MIWWRVILAVIAVVHGGDIEAATLLAKNCAAP